MFPPILAVVWWLHGRRVAGEGKRGLFEQTRGVVLGITGYLLILLLADFAVTGFATMPLSRSRGDHPSLAGKFGSFLGSYLNRIYETPIPQDLVGFATQVHHQMSGGASYLLGERRMTGWRHYYFVALAVKVPLAFWLLSAGRLLASQRANREDRQGPGDAILPLTIGLFLAITAAGSSRNYGFRYLLPLSPLAIVWVSRLAERPTTDGRRPSSALADLGHRAGTGGAGARRRGDPSVRADLLQRAGRRPARGTTHPFRLQPRLGTGPQVPGEPAAP